MDGRNLLILFIIFRKTLLSASLSVPSIRLPVTLRSQCCWGVPPFQRVLGAVVMPLPGPHRDRFPIDDLVGLDEDGIRPERDVFDVVDNALLVACGASVKQTDSPRQVPATPDASADATRTLHHPEDEFLVTPNGAKIALDIQPEGDPNRQARGCIKLEAVAKHGRYKATIIDDARWRLEGM